MFSNHCDFHVSFSNFSISSVSSQTSFYLYLCVSAIHVLIHVFSLWSLSLKEMNNFLISNKRITNPNGSWVLNNSLAWCLAVPQGTRLISQEEVVASKTDNIHWTTRVDKFYTYLKAFYHIASSIGDGYFYYVDFKYKPHTHHRLMLKYL